MLIRRVVRPMLAASFVVGGIDALRNPGTRPDKASGVGPSIARRLGLPEDPATLVKLNAGVMVGSGSLLAMGRLPRLSSLALLGSLVPTTVAGHPFWEESDPQVRGQQRMQFLKNLSMGAGLVFAALDTGGRPSVGWWARRAARKGRERLPHST